MMPPSFVFAVTYGPKREMLLVARGPGVPDRGEPVALDDVRAASLRIAHRAWGAYGRPVLRDTEVAS